MAPAGPEAGPLCFRTNVVFGQGIDKIWFQNDLGFVLSQGLTPSSCVGVPAYVLGHGQKRRLLKHDIFLMNWDDFILEKGVKTISRFLNDIQRLNKKKALKHYAKAYCSNDIRQ